MEKWVEKRREPEKNVKQICLVSILYSFGIGLRHDEKY